MKETQIKEKERGTSERQGNQTLPWTLDQTKE